MVLMVLTSTWVYLKNVKRQRWRLNGKTRSTHTPHIRDFPGYFSLSLPLSLPTYFFTLSLIFVSSLNFHFIFFLIICTRIHKVKNENENESLVNWLLAALSFSTYSMYIIESELSKYKITLIIQTLKNILLLIT